MKNIFFLLVGMCFLSFSNCTKDAATYELTDEVPVVPDSIEIDIDENGEIDYRIKYANVLVEGPTVSSGIVGFLEQNNGNEILNERFGDDLFLRNLNEVKPNVSEPFFWSSTSMVSIVSVYNHIPSNGWRANWEVNSNTEYPSYFIGLKVKKDNEILLGWIEFEVDTGNGLISIVDKGLL